MLEIINGIIQNPKQLPHTLYFFDPHTQALCYIGKTGDSFTFPMPENATFIPLDDYDSTKKIPIYDSKAEMWHFIAKQCHLLDENNFFIETKINPLLNTQESPIPKNTEVSPPDEFQNPWFDENLSTWKDMPTPGNLCNPLWSIDSETWVETSSLENLKLWRRGIIKEGFEKSGLEGVEIILGSKTIKMDATETDIMRLENAIKAALLAPETSINITDFNNENHSCTIEEVQEIINKIILNFGLLFKKKQDLNDLIEEKTEENKDEIYNIKWE